MTYFNWIDLCQQPILKASSEKYAQLVHDSTTELHEPIQSILSTLNRRAMGLTKCANFESALRDAHVMQQVSPTSALGYLSEASIYSEQGKQRQVIDICKHAIRFVHTKDLVKLQQVIADAEDREGKGVDFIRQLPLDIVISTLIPMIVDSDYIDPSNPSPYLYVSHLWRNCILQSIGGLRLRIGAEEEDDVSDIIELTQHIKALDIECYSEGTWLGDFIADNDFSSLREIEIRRFTTLHLGHFLSALKSVSSTLTHFFVDMEDGPVLGVPDVLLVCPNLMSLSLRDVCNADTSSLPMAPWPTLTTLSLTFIHRIIACDQIIEIWKHFPSLKKLEIHPCPDIQSALIVSEYSSTLKKLEISMEGSDLRLTYTDEGNHTQEAGITKLVICTDYSAETTCKDTSSIIKRYHNTLEHLEWDMGTSWDTETIDNIQFPRLTQLGLYWSGWEMIRHAPILEELKLTFRIISTHPQVLDTIPPHLKSLDLDLDAWQYYEDHSSILSYLNRMARQSKLKELVLRFNSRDDIASILDAIYRHDHLECLKISFTSEWESYPMERFLNGLVKACPCLSRLELKCTNAPSTHSIETLKRLPQLHKFAFSIHRTCDNDSFWNAIRTFPQLKCITIYPSPVAQDARILHLNQQRPDMKIIVGSTHLFHHPFP